MNIGLLPLGIILPENFVDYPFSTDKTFAASSTFVTLFSFKKPVFTYNFAPTIKAVFLVIVFNML